jgi:hypothetical protein
MLKKVSLLTTVALLLLAGALVSAEPAPDGSVEWPDTGSVVWPGEGARITSVNGGWLCICLAWGGGYVDSACFDECMFWGALGCALATKGYVACVIAVRFACQGACFIPRFCAEWDCVFVP